MTSAFRLDPADFDCPICRDLAYKPVVNSCGHVHCFWCVEMAMNPSSESHCPMCRKVFSHFPRICTILHNFYAKVFPGEYADRAEFVYQEEKEREIFSPAMIGGSISDGIAEHSPPTHKCSGCLTVSVLASSENRNETEAHNRTICWTDFKCASCCNLLERPRVLNCGHSVCTSCLESLEQTVSADSRHGRRVSFVCPECCASQPNSRIVLCIPLHNLIQSLFPELSREREEAVRTLSGKAAIESQSASTPAISPGHGGSSWPSEQAVADESKSGKMKDWKEESLIQQGFQQCLKLHEKMQSATSEEERKALSDELKRVEEETFVHIGVGCDGCGVYPIVGKRYRCRDCPERIGYDLCQACYSHQGLIPGRFNQLHGSGHTLVETRTFSELHSLRILLPDVSDMELMAWLSDDSTD